MASFLHANDSVPLSDPSRNASSSCSSLGLCSSVDLEQPFTIESADLNHNGVEDLIVADRQSGIVHQLSNTGISFDSTQISNRVGANWRDIAVGDLEGDGDVEIFLASRGLDVIEIHLNTCCNSN